MKKIYLVFFTFLSLSINCTFNVGTPNNTPGPAAANTTQVKDSPAAENKNNTAQSNNGSQTETAISIETFTDFPPEVDGCSCYLSAGESDLKAGKYIYVDNREEFASMKINGTMTKFNRLEEKEVSKNHWVKKFENKNYELVVDITQSGSNGPFPQKGTIKLTRKGGQTITKDVNGECGC